MDDPLEVHGVEELFEKEQEILERIRRRRNGGLLFTLSPLRLLADLNVDLGPAVREWVEEHEPEAINRTAPGAYQSVAELEEDSTVVVHVDGLFRRPDR
jgi:hypothetical protein